MAPGRRRAAHRRRALCCAAAAGGNMLLRTQSQVPKNLTALSLRAVLLCSIVERCIVPEDLQVVQCAHELRSRALLDRPRCSHPGDCKCCPHTWENSSHIQPYRQAF